MKRWEDQVIITVNPPLTPRAVPNLRGAAGLERLDADYPAVLARYWAVVGGLDAAGELVAWCAILSDGMRHAVLLDVVVHPRWQRRGLGLALVGRAVEYVRTHGIAVVHVNFLPEQAAFFERCGFQLRMGGLYTGDR